MLLKVKPTEVFGVRSRRESERTRGRCTSRDFRRESWKNHRNKAGGRAKGEGEDSARLSGASLIATSKGRKCGLQAATTEDVRIFFRSCVHARRLRRTLQTSDTSDAEFRHSNQERMDLPCIAHFRRLKRHPEGQTPRERRDSLQATDSVSNIPMRPGSRLQESG